MDDIDVEKNEKGIHDTHDLNHFKRGKGSSQRFVQPRMSLLGKPLNYRQHKRDARYRRTQARMYNFLERPKDWRAISYHLLV
jgi:potassium voltage-gated channel KQT-like subfamily protein